MEFSIWLEDENAKSKHQLGLVRTKFEGSQDRSAIELSRKLFGLGPELSFEWDSTHRALCYLLLIAFSSGDEPHIFKVRGGSRSLARSLHRLVIKETKDATWIVRMFTHPEDINKHLANFGAIRLPTSFIYTELIRRKRLHIVGEYTMRLGIAWRHARFNVYISERPKACAAKSYKLLAHLIKHEKPLETITEHVDFILSAPVPPESLKDNGSGLLRLHLGALHDAEIQQVIFIDIYEGSTRLVIRLNRDDADRLIENLVDGTLETSDIHEVAFFDETDSHFLRKKVHPKAISVDLQNPEQSRPSIRKFCRKAYLFESVRRPWIRLMSLLSTDVNLSPARNVLVSSTNRSYSFIDLKRDWKPLRTDLFIGLFSYTSLCALLITATCLLSSRIGLPSAIGLGLLTGLALATLGSQGCSTMISPLACTAGIIFVGWGFGFAHSIILGVPQIAGTLSANRILEDPFITINGGLIGLTAPLWRDHLSGPVITVIFFMTGLGIALSGWLMGQPFVAGGRYEPKSVGRDLAGAFLGALAGVGIPATMGLSKLLERALFKPSQAFSLAFAATAFLATGFIVWSQRRTILRVLACGAFQGGIAWILSSLTFLNAGSISGLVFGCMACAYFQATWFGSAFEIGRKFSSPRAGVWATILEGVVGYTAFVVLRAAHFV